MNSSFVAVVGNEIWRFLKAHPAQRAACIHVPLAWRVLGLFAQLVRHNLKNAAQPDRFNWLDEQYWIAVSRGDFSSELLTAAQWRSPLAV
jgi:hypothetical protein